MLTLALIGLGLTVAGGLLSMYGQYQQQQAEKQKLANNQRAYDAQQTAINAQLAQIKEQRGQVQELHGLQEQQLAQQGINIAEQGRQAAGSQKATAAVGNVGGASVLRQAEAIQTKIDRAMAGLKIEGKKLDIQFQQQQTALNVAEAGAQANLVQSQVNEENKQADLQFLQDYGWMSIAATGLNTAAKAINIGANMDWSGLFAPSMTPPSSSPLGSQGGAMPWYGNESYGSSLALENFNYSYPGSSAAVGMYF